LAGKEYLQELFNGLLDGDGNKKHTVLSTVSKRLVENSVELAIKIGLTASFRQYQPSNKTYIKNRPIHSLPFYLVCFGYTEPNLHRRNMKQINYVGDVWCLNVENKNFLIERNGKFCFSGNSMSRYGNQQPPFDETLSPKPIDVYASNKVAMEEITRQLAGAHGFDWTIIVPRNVFGERQSLQDRFRNFIGITINHILRNEDVIIYGDGNQVRSFSYIKNSINCYLECLHDKTNNQIINIGGMIPKTINEVAEMIISNFPNYKGKIQHLADRHGEVKYAWGTFQKSIDLLGYKEDVSLEQGIKNMCDWTVQLGPQEWSKDKLSLINDKVPQTWR
jgi:dTDP-D-glucose 4,6-dehydratase